MTNLNLTQLLYRAAELGISSSIAHDVVAREGIEGLARYVVNYEKPTWGESDGPIASGTEPSEEPVGLSVPLPENEPATKPRKPGKNGTR